MAWNVLLETYLKYAQFRGRNNYEVLYLVMTIEDASSKRLRQFEIEIDVVLPAVDKHQAADVLLGLLVDKTIQAT